MTIRFAVVALALLASNTGMASTISFDDITTGSSTDIPSGYAGYDWVAYDPASATAGGGVTVSTGNNATMSGAYSTLELGFEVSRSGGGLFDAGSFYAAYELATSDLLITAFNNGSQVFQTTTALFGTTPTLITLGVSGIDLLRIETTSIDVFSVDDITLTAVPVPAAVWLFASGALGLAGIARRRT